MEQILNSFKLSLKYLKNYPKFWFYLFLRLLIAIGDVLVPVLIGYIIVLYTNHESMTAIYWSVSLIVLILIISPVLDKIQFIGAWFIAFRAAHDFRRDAVKRLRHVGLSFWQDHDKGNVLKIIDQAFEHLIYVSGSIVHAFVPFLGKVMGIVISTTFIDPIISLIFLLDAVFFVINIKFLLPKEAEAGILERRAQEAVHGRINEYLVNYKTVVYLNLFKRQEKEIFQYNEDAYKAYQKRERLSGWKWYFNNQTHAICIAIIIVYSMWQVSQGNLQVGMLATVGFFALRISDTMTEFAWNISELMNYSNSIRRYNETFETVSDHSFQGVETAVDFQELILRNVSLQQKDRETLRNINLTIKKGEKVAIVGFTGSGKTSLIDILLKVTTSYSGDILINQHNYQELQVHDLAKVYSIVPQDVQLFKGSLTDNIAIDSESSDKEIDEVVEIASLRSLIQKLPKGIESHIHEGASNVSGGERQRIGIARALLQNHPVLILDEATASLDPKTEREVITNIISAHPEHTVLYITHKYALLNLFDHIIVMNEGSIIERGSFDSLVEKGGLFKDLFEASQLQ